MLERRVLDKPLTASYFLGVALPIWPTWLYSRRLVRGLAMPLAMRRDMGWISLSLRCSLPCLLILKGRPNGSDPGCSAAMAVAAKLFIAGAWYIILGGLAGMLVAFVTYRERQEPA